MAALSSKPTSVKLYCSKNYFQFVFVKKQRRTIYFIASVAKERKNKNFNLILSPIFLLKFC